MYNLKKDSISTTQTTFIVSKSMIGTGILVMARGISEKVGTPDGWISVIVSGMLALLTGYIIVKLSQRFPDQTFFEYSQIVAGKHLGTVFGIGLALYYLILVGYLLRFMGEVVRMYLLDKTPIEVTMIVFLSLAAYLTVGGLNPIARLIELFFPIVVVLLILLIILSFRDVEWDNFRPILGDGVVPVWKGIEPSVFAYSGYEVMLILLAFMKEPRQGMKSTLGGIALVIPLYTFVVAICIASLTVEEVKTATWPTLSIAKNIELPGGFFERFESVFSVLWVMSMYTTFVLYQYAASLGFSQIFKKKHRIFTYACLPIIYIIAKIPSDLNSVLKFGDLLGLAAAFFIIVMPLGFWITAKLRRRGIETR